MREIKMLKVLFQLAITAVLFLGNFVAAGDTKKVYGDGLAGAELIEISEILEDPEGFEGKTVRVQGKVMEVCPNMGCWMDIEDSTGRIQIKVDDGVIVFPTTAVGKESIAEGKVEVLSLTKEKYAGWLEHMAQEKGETFDPATVGDPPYRIVRIRGTGAEIK